VFDGTHGGSLRRRILDSAGNGISLEPDVFGVVMARSIAPDRLELVIPANAGAEGRFWRELARFVGTFSAPNTAPGEWNCAPFDIDSGGYVDTMYTARGTWVIAPLG
jgi:hypothetical protein